MKLTFKILLLILLPFQLAVVRYNYSYYGEVIHSAPGLNFSAYFNEQTLGVPFNSPEDMVVYDGKLYIITSGSNNLVVVDERFDVAMGPRYVFKKVTETVPDDSKEPTEDNPNPTKEIEVEKFLKEDGKLAVTYFVPSESYKDYLIEQGESVPEYYTLNKPRGLDVKDTGIYIADTENLRILKLNHDFEVVDIFTEVDNIAFEGKAFKPKKITTDTTGRMYVVAQDMFEGIIELENNGSFNRFTGVNPIKLTPFDIFKRSLMSEEQIARLPKFLPTEYTNVTMTAENFIYATSLPSKNNDEAMIQLINPKGVDVLQREGYAIPKGDQQYVINMNNYVVDGPSTLADIAIYKDGIYTVLDQKRSRLFTYDSEGNLLYINGEAGNQSDKFAEGVAITYFNDNLLVLDRRQRTVVVYEHTNFGKKVNEAIMFHGMGEFEQAAKVWEEVLVLNTNYEVAYKGIGKYYLRNGDYKTAMEYFKYGHDQYYYSKAFKQYRNNIIKANFGYILAIIIIIPTGLYVWKQIKKRKGSKVS
ncbi:hypothetical protein [Acholeplasma hippikon]|nr:hypothetical protein [Acholeplasma hippikon]